MKPEVPQCIRFSNKLLVEVICRASHNVLQISREDRFPTLEEYMDIINSWPYDLDAGHPEQFGISGRKYLLSVWPKMQLPTY
jgi:hypothetical protein